MSKAKSKNKKAKKPAEADAAPAPEPEEVSKPIEKEAVEQRLLRLQADFDNFRKRTVRERADWYQRANEELVMELLPALDHFELGIEIAKQHETDAAVVDGFQLVYGQLTTALNKIGLQAVDAEGQEFDPHLHEAMTHIPSDEHPADVVVAQTRRGYKLGEKLVRAAQVVVSSGPVGPEDEGAGEGDQ